jgi:hypothetical protein
MNIVWLWSEEGVGGGGGDKCDVEMTQMVPMLLHRGTTFIDRDRTNPSILCVVRVPECNLKVALVDIVYQLEEG